jgi:flagellar protein FlgJ
MSSNRNQRLAEVASVALRLEAETGVPARMLLAQWAIESRWGARPVGNFNVFGVKRAKRHTRFCAVETREVIDGKEVRRVCEFADYDSLDAACRDYAWLITRGAPYRAAWRQYQQTRDVAQLIESVARIYATDPNYARLANQIAGQTNVTTAIEGARAVHA